MKHSVRKLMVGACVLGLFAGLVGPASADEVHNDVPVESDVKQATIVSNDAGVTVKYWVKDTDATECDAKNVPQGDSVTVTIETPTGVTATPSSVGFNQEECTSGVKKSVQFTSTTPGVHTVTHTLTFTLKTGGTRTMTNQADFTLNVRPRPATGMQATAGDQKVDLSWTHSLDNPNIDGYRVYQDGVEVKTVTTNSAEITGLTNGTAYCFTVKAYKGSLESDASNQACATPVSQSVTSGKAGPAVANEYINTFSDADVGACKTQMKNDNVAGLNRHQSNWRGVIISNVAKVYNARDDEWEDDDVIAMVDVYCGFSSD